MASMLTAGSAVVKPAPIFTFTTRPMPPLPLFGALAVLTFGHHAPTIALMTKPPTISETIAARVRHYRQKRRWSMRHLAELCAEHGVATLTQASLTNIERGLAANSDREGRAVTVPELFVLAYVLDVPPAALMLPLGDSNAVEICPDVNVTPYAALQWMTGHKQIGSAEKWNTAQPLFYYGAAERCLRFEEIANMKSSASAARYGLYEKPWEILKARRRYDLQWKKNPESRSSYENNAVVRNEPLPGLPISDDEYVEEYRKLKAASYEKHLGYYSSALWKAHDSKMQLPTVPQLLYDDLSALQSKLELLPDEISQRAGEHRKLPAPSRSLLPPGIEIAEDA